MTQFTAEEQARIRSCKILRDIPAEPIEQTLVERADLRTRLPANSVFIEAGDVRPGLTLIASGTVELFVTDAKGRENVVDFATAGGTLAEESLFNDAPVQYSARSLTRAAVLFLPDDLLGDWIAHYPAFAQRLITLVAKRIDFLNRDVYTFRTKRATSRLICYMLCHFNKAPMAADGSFMLQIDIPRNKLASRIGVSASQVSRSLRELQEHGLMVAHGSGFFIPNVPALSKYVCPGGCDF